MSKQHALLVNPEKIQISHLDTSCTFPENVIVLAATLANVGSLEKLKAASIRC
jgi:hypothetical protein